MRDDPVTIYPLKNRPGSWCVKEKAWARADGKEKKTAFRDLEKAKAYMREVEKRVGSGRKMQSVGTFGEACERYLAMKTRNKTVADITQRLENIKAYFGAGT